ncbi:MAG: disulfide bond formation protein DsbA [Parcubacteria group bacterium]|nr:disulfide bond formation protein DsbA [Parcubacteria group bacterium]
MEKDSKNVFMEKYLTPIAVLVGAVIIAGAFIFGHPSAATGTAGAPGAAPAVKVNIKDVKTDGDPFIGNANAPVTLAFWFDYQCPFCKQFETTTGGQIYDTYVKTGKVKIVFKDFQFLGNDSTTDAEFARAMWEAYPDKFYEWYQAMFVAQDAEGDQGFGDLASVKTLTAKIQGVDVNKVTTLMTQNKAKYDTAIAADRDEAQKFGISGTPAMVIGTTMLSGAQPFATVAPLIDAQLKK